jgi:hypothetical protein
MGKKVIRLTESDLERIVSKVISESREDMNTTKGIQEFLNLKKITGSNKLPLKIDGLTDNNLQSQTSQAISKYQSMIGVNPADGVWGENTWAKLSKDDVKKLKDLIAKHGGPVDKLLNLIGF